MQENSQFWKDQANKYKDNIHSVNFDSVQEKMEIEVLFSLLQDARLICDLGCGIGHSVFSLREKGIMGTFHALDFTKEMIDVANNTKNNLSVENVHFYHKSATDKSIVELFEKKFDTLISKRLLINLKGEDKFLAIKNIHSLLEEDGLYIMIENFLKPLETTNKARQTLNLDPINVHHFNEYLDENFLKEISSYFTVEKVLDPFSTYYFTSRVLNAYDAQQKENTPSYEAPINLATLELFLNNINPISGYAPQQVILLRKKSL